MDSLSGMANLAICYLEGKGTEKNIEKGLEWMNTASKKGNGVASLKLANFYTDGLYAEKDYQIARSYLERGMDQKYGDAVMELARFYKEGLGVEIDLVKAKELEELALVIFQEDD